jgi:hypothetical protein
MKSDGWTALTGEGTSPTQSRPTGKLPWKSQMLSSISMMSWLSVLVERAGAPLRW